MENFSVSEIRFSRKMSLAHFLSDTAWHTFSCKDTKGFILVLVRQISILCLTEQTLGIVFMKLLRKYGEHILIDL